MTAIQEDIKNRLALLEATVTQQALASKTFHDQRGHSSHLDIDDPITRARWLKAFPCPDMIESESDK